MYAWTTDKAKDKDPFRDILSMFMSILYVNKYLHRSRTKSYFLQDSEEMCNTHSVTEHSALLENVLI